MRKGQQIQISKQMFLEIYKLIITLNDYELDYNIRARVQALESAIEAKFEAMTRREAFTEYKTAEANTDDRETKRRKYLELAEVHKNWISPKETSL